MSDSKILKTLLRGATLLILFAAPAWAELREIGTLVNADGDVLLKNKGLWQSDIRQDHPLYHGDKIITSDGTCRIKYLDGALTDVRPNTSVRLAHLIEEKVIKGKSQTAETREIRVFTGKVHFKSGITGACDTKLAAPSAAADLKGSEVEFGTDGETVFMNQTEGGATKYGEIADAPPPDVTAEQAARSEERRLSVDAQRIREEYLAAVKALLEAAAPDPLLLAAGDDWITAVILAANASSRKKKATADEILMLAALYSVADHKANIAENQKLLNNPDPEVRERAEKALKICQKALKEAEEVLEKTKEITKKINDIIKEMASITDPAALKKKTEEAKGVIKEMIKTQKESVQKALGQNLIGDAWTAGIDELLFKDKEVVIEKHDLEIDDAGLDSDAAIDWLIAAKLQQLAQGKPEQPGAMGQCAPDPPCTICIGGRPVHTNSPCDDGDPCTINDTCRGAACVGSRLSSCEKPGRN